MAQHLVGLFEESMNETKIHITLIPDSDSFWQHLQFRQEGFPGLNLQIDFLSEFIKALEDTTLDTFVCHRSDYGFIHSKTKSVYVKYANRVPLLQLSADQRARLIAYLRETYKEVL